MKSSVPSHVLLRLNCFVCDYDLCVSCVEARGAVKLSGIFKDDFDEKPPSYFEATKDDSMNLQS